MAFRPFYGEYQLLGSSRAFWSDLYAIARMTCDSRRRRRSRAPSASPGYYESDMDTLMLHLMSAAPIYPELERAKLAHSLAALALWFGADHPLVEAVLQGARRRRGPPRSSTARGSRRTRPARSSSTAARPP